MDRATLVDCISKLPKKLQAVASSLELERSRQLYSGPLLENIKALYILTIFLQGGFSDRRLPAKECAGFPGHCEKCEFRDPDQLPTKPCKWECGPDENQYSFEERTLRDNLTKAFSLLGELRDGNRIKGDVKMLKQVSDGIEVGLTELNFHDADNEPLPMEVTKVTKKKRSTEKGEARTKIVAALTDHHKYKTDSCLNFNPIGVRDLAEKADVSPGSVSKFFKDEFRSHLLYQRACVSESSQLLNALRMLNGDFSPYILFNSEPTEEDAKDEEE